VTEEELFALELPLLLEAIYQRYFHDFRHYASASLRRRLDQAVKRHGCASLSELQHRVLRDPKVFSGLLQDLTIHVTEFFRDPDFFLALRREVLPVLGTYPSIKVWIAGCSTGEEVYSLLILLDEAGLLDRSLVYATDIDPEVLAAGRRGVYALDQGAAFTANYQQAGGTRAASDYYTAAYDGLVVDRRLRDKAVFSDHSLATDGVFAEVQLVMCRNVLIYFDTALQDRALALFSGSLVRGGVLALGSKESIRFSEHADDFVELVPDQRLYKRR
jgi:chemotaxis protein methyltransferase CheR